MLAYMFSFIDRQILVLMIEPIKSDLNLSDTQFSSLHGLAFSLVYAFMGLSLAYVVDHFRVLKLLRLALFFWSISTAFCSLSKSFFSFSLAEWV